MDDITQNNANMPQNFDPTRRLKKVKRPIKRIIPGQMSQPATPNTIAGNNAASEPQSWSNNSQGSLNIDDILDGNTNLPVSAKEADISNQNNDFQPQFINESDITPPKVPFKEQLMQGNMFTVKGVSLIALLVFVFGIFFAKIFFTQQTVVRDGLQGVVFNPEVPRGRARCGVAERTQGCVLYIMNPQRQELTGRDFYDLASQLTSRQRFVIETGNMRYSNVKIRPGDIAQLNIPPLQ